MTEFTERLAALRAIMKTYSYDAYIIFHNDAHNSEYLNDADKRMGWLTTFQGSNGHMLVTHDKAMLWTDGRYWLACEQCLPEEWTLMKIATDVPTWFNWIVENMPISSKIGYDANITPANGAITRSKFFAEKGYQFESSDTNLVNDIWTDRPAYPDTPVYILDVQYSGLPTSVKLDAVVEKMKQEGADHLLLGMLDEVAWVLNLRGSDILYNPVFFAWLVISANPRKVTLFINQVKVADISSHISENGITIEPYEAIGAYLQSLEGVVLANGEESTAGVFSKINNPLSKMTPVKYMKSIKNDREIAGFRECQVRDGAALCMYLAWLSKQLKEGRTDITEFTGSQELKKFRSKMKDFVDLSFEAISSVGPNAAIIHYKPEPDTSSTIVTDKIYLLDSGGQYLDGTTDTTRTLHFGTPTDEEKEMYTRVLKGNLNIQVTKWPEYARMSGSDLDLLARQPLWDVAKNFGHGTGHGVGHHLNVHEGPQGISRLRKTVLVPGMNSTDEPGYYEEGAFGIRIEDLLFVVPSQYEGFLEWENVTMAPYERNLIDVSQLSPAQIDFINTYHKKVYDKLTPLMEEMGDADAIQWLRAATAKL